jgi:hypothetical protein
VFLCQNSVLITVISPFLLKGVEKYVPLFHSDIFNFISDMLVKLVTGSRAESSLVLIDSDGEGVF